MRVRVNIGCGMKPLMGWRNFDNSFSIRLAKIPILPELLYRATIINLRQYEFIKCARRHKIEYGDVTERLPLRDGTVQVLYSSHVLEHLDRAEAERFLKEAKRVLCTGGIIRLSVPDLRKQVLHYIDTGDADAFIKATYLCQPRPTSLVNRLRVALFGTRHHHWMYDGPSLCRLLQSQGFSNSTILPSGKSRIKDIGPLDLHERSSESVYVEAENV